MLRRLAIGGAQDVDSPFAALPSEKGPREAERFDTLSRSLLTPDSRRDALRLLAGALLGGVVPLRYLLPGTPSGHGELLRPGWAEL